ncbi:MAG: hypothetical protein HY053_06050 [Proteobacteria bacterium]|nr:hypothetical protein [Pseudomonadota bacterium]
MTAYGGDTHWRNSMKPARFFFMDARAAIPFVFMLLHLRIWTFFLAMFTTLIFYFLEQRGMSFDAALRGLRVWFVGCKRPPIKHSDRHRMVDYAFEPWPEKFKDEPLEGGEEAVTPEEDQKAASAKRSATANPKKVIRPEVPQVTPPPSNTTSS